MTDVMHVRPFLVQTEFYRSIRNVATSLDDPTSQAVCLETN